MSIQPLNNSASFTYPTSVPMPAPVSAKVAAEAPHPPKEVSTPPSVDTRVEEKKTDKPEEQKEAVRQATEKANRLIQQGLSSDLKFTVDEETGIDVVKVVDTKTKEVIRQIPAQEMLVIAKHLDAFQGLLIREQA